MAKGGTMLACFHQFLLKEQHPMDKSPTQVTWYLVINGGTMTIQSAAYGTTGLTSLFSPAKNNNDYCWAFLPSPLFSFPY